jgi:hypothetical protein
MGGVLYLVAVMLFAPHALAKPVIGVVSQPSNELPDCRVRLASDRVPKGEVILRWLGRSGQMHVDGRQTLLDVREPPCQSDCVIPGRSGYREFEFVADEIRVVLRKRVSCAADAEVCSGLPQGPARMIVRSSAGTGEFRVETDYCDL